MRIRLRSGRAASPAAINRWRWAPAHRRKTARRGGRDTTIRPAIAALQSAGALQAQQIGALQQGQAQLVDFVELNQREARRGIAAAVALTTAAFPSAPGRTSCAANTAVYRGEVAFSASLAYRLNLDTPFAVTGGAS